MIGIVVSLFTAEGGSRMTGGPPFGQIPAFGATGSTTGRKEIRIAAAGL